MRLSTSTVQQGSTGTKGWKANVSARQEEAILTAAGEHGLTTDDLYGYVTTGDQSYCTPEVFSTLQAIVKATKEGMEASQAKRIWPRKVASVLLAA